MRVIVYAFPVVVVAFGLYFILFPSEVFRYYASQPSISKFEIQKNTQSNEISLGVFPHMPNRFIDFSMTMKDVQKSKCQNISPTVTLEKIHEAFLDPIGDQIADADELKQYLYKDNNSDYPNGTLMHVKTTDQVSLISEGKKILFPSPEIFRAFGYDFNNLTDVDQATLDQFPDAENKVFSWSMRHPADTIFQAYPSHKIYLIAGDQRHEIMSKDILDAVWPKNYTIPASDSETETKQVCNPSIKQGSNLNLSCRFDNLLFSQSFGGFYYFSIKIPDACLVDDLHPDTVSVAFVSEISPGAVKNSLRNIFASVLNRYLRKQQ